MHKLPLIFIFPFILTIDHCLWVDGFNTILPQRQTISVAHELHPTGPCKESPQGNPPVIFVQRCTPRGYKNPPLFPVPNRSPKPFASRSILFLVLSSISRPPKDMSLPWSHIALDFGSSSFFDVFECTSMSVDPRTFRYDTNSNESNRSRTRTISSHTVCSSTPLLISSSILCFFRASNVSSAPILSSALAARFFFPETSSAIRCCRSAGVSVQSELSTFFAGAAVLANWRALSFVGSRAAGIHGSFRLQGVVFKGVRTAQ